MAIAKFVAGKTGIKYNPNWEPWVRDLEWLPDGSYLGIAHGVVRYNADDTQDFSYGIANSPANFGSLDAIDILGSGKVLVAGRFQTDKMNPWDEDLYAFRLLANGDLDPSFGGGKGWVGVDPGKTSAGLTGMVTQLDGKIVLVGSERPVAVLPDGTVDVPPFTRIVMTRLTADGALDKTFGSNGLVFSATNNVLTQDVLAQKDGKLLIACQVRQPDGLDRAAICRYNANGTLDTTFGVNGYANINFSGSHPNSPFALHLALQPDGRILLVCSAPTDLPQQSVFMGIGAVRLEANGQVDTTFGNNGFFQHFLAPDNDTWLPGGARSRRISVGRWPASGRGAYGQ